MGAGFEAHEAQMVWNSFGSNQVFVVERSVQALLALNVDLQEELAQYINLKSNIVLRKLKKAGKVKVEFFKNFEERILT